MTKSRRRPRPVEELKAHWDKRDDIVEVMADMFGHHATAVSPALVPEELSPVSLTADIPSPDKTSPDGELPHRALSIDVESKPAPDKTSPDITPPAESSFRNSNDESNNITTPVDLTPAVSFPAHNQVPSSASPDTASPAITTPAVMSGRARPYNIHRCILAQDAHSRTEEDCYQTLWRFGRPAGDDSFRLAQVSMSELSTRLRITQKNLRPVLARLAEKLAIEQVASFDATTKAARVWKVYSYKSILERRRAAGLEWVVRDRGVRFVPPPDLTSPVDMREASPDDMTATEISTPVISSKTSPVKTPPPLLGKTSERNSSSPLLVRALMEVTGKSDDDAVERIANSCRETVPDVTDEEISTFIREEGKRFGRMRNVENLTGMLIRQVPRRCVGESFRQFRELEQKRRETEERQRIEWRQQAQAILDDPNSSQEDKDWARGLLEME